MQCPRLQRLVVPSSGLPSFAPPIAKLIHLRSLHVYCDMDLGRLLHEGNLFCFS